MTQRTTFQADEAFSAAQELGVDFSKEPFDLEELRMGMDVELEHGRRDPETNVTGDDPVLTAKIALAHLHEMPDYYERLAEMEAAAEAES